MIGIAFKLLTAWASKLASLFADGLRWLFAERHRPVLAVLLVIVALLWMENGSVKRQRDAEHDGRIAEANAHRATVQFYTDAARIADQRAKENVARVEAEYAAAAKGASDENTRLRAEFDRRLAGFMRRNAGGAAADTSGADATGLPGSPALPAGPVQEPGLALVPVTDLERCAAIAAQLIALIGYVEDVSGVAVTPVEVADRPQ